MQQIGHIQQLWRYPVKGLAGESVQSSPCGPQGIAGDRAWAIWDVRRKEIQSCKFRPELLRCRASYRDEVGSPLEIAFPEGSIRSSSDPAIHEAFSDLVGHPSELKSLPSADALDFFRRYRKEGHDWLSELRETFTRLPGESLPEFLKTPDEVAEFVGLPGTFFLVAPLHIVTSATMSYLKELHPESDWDIRRFRPNIVIETDTGEGLLEQGWLGRKIMVNGLELNCIDTAVRCGAVTRPLEELPRDASMLRSIVKDADQNLGIYAETQGETTIQVGDSVYLR